MDSPESGHEREALSFDHPTLVTLSDNPAPILIVPGMPGIADSHLTVVARAETGAWEIKSAWKTNPSAETIRRNDTTGEVEFVGENPDMGGNAYTDISLVKRGKAYKIENVITVDNRKYNPLERLTHPSVNISPVTVVGPFGEKKRITPNGWACGSLKTPIIVDVGGIDAESCAQMRIQKDAAGRIVITYIGGAGIVSRVLEPGVMCTMGRDNFSPENRNISRKHMVIGVSPDGTMLVVKDGDVDASTNGTYITRERPGMSGKEKKIISPDAHRKGLPSSREIIPFTYAVGSNSIASETHPDENQDRCFSSVDKGYMGVIDGIGGKKGGETAAEIVKNAVQTHFDALPTGASVDQVKQSIRDSWKKAQAEMKLAARSNPLLAKMGAVAAVCKIVEGKGERTLVIGQAGDSRIAIVKKDGKLVLLTQDEGILMGVTKEGFTDWLNTENESDKIIYGFISDMPLAVPFVNTIAKNFDYIQSDSDMSDLATTLFDNPYKPRTINTPEDMEKLLKALWKRRNMVINSISQNTTAEPTIITYELTSDDACILAITDGVYDNLTREEIRQQLRDSLAAGNTLDEVTSSLNERAYARAQQVEGPRPHIRAKKDDATTLLFKLQ